VNSNILALNRRESSINDAESATNRYGWVRFSKAVYFYTTKPGSSCSNDWSPLPYDSRAFLAHWSSFFWIPWSTAPPLSHPNGIKKHKFNQTTTVKSERSHRLLPRIMRRVQWLLSEKYNLVCVALPLPGAIPLFHSNGINQHNFYQTTAMHGPGNTFDSITQSNSNLFSNGSFFLD